MRPVAKKYTTAYKKRVDVERDTYIPRRAPKETVQCTGCGAFYYRRRWTLVRPEEFKTPRRFRSVYCPACRKIKERYPSGELHLIGIDGAERRHVARILRNEEERAREKNPLERIMRLEAVNGDWRVETTTEKLAQRLGRSLKKARGGVLVYKWSHNNKFIRVLWKKKVD
jgi:hypothetical protein